MAFFKNQDGRVFAYEDGAPAEYIRPGLTPITPEEAAELRAPTAGQAAAIAAAEARASAIANARAAARLDPIVQFLRDSTLAECDQYVVANVTDLASAKAYLRKLTLVVATLAKQELQ